MQTLFATKTRRFCEQECRPLCLRSISQILKVLSRSVGWGSIQGIHENPQSTLALNFHYRHKSADPFANLPFGHGPRLVESYKYLDSAQQASSNEIAKNGDRKMYAKLFCLHRPCHPGLAWAKGLQSSNSTSWPPRCVCLSQKNVVNGVLWK